MVDKKIYVKSCVIAAERDKIAHTSKKSEKYDKIQMQLSYF